MKKIGAYSVPLLLVMALLAGCGGGGGGGGSESQTGSTGSGGTSVNLTLKVPGASKVSGAPSALGVVRIVLTVSGAGMSPVQTDVPISGNQEDIVDLTLPSGSARLFRADVYDAQGLAFVGATQADLFGARRDVFIVLEPVPRVLGLSQMSAMVGDTIKIRGTAFGDEQGESFLTIGGIEASPFFDRDAVWSETSPFDIPLWDGGKTIATGGQIEIVRWTDTEIIVTVPQGLSPGPKSVVVSVATDTLVGSKVSPSLLTIEIVDTIYGVGGELATGNLDKFALPHSFTSTPVVVTDISSDNSASSSVALSSNGETAVEADSGISGLGERIDGFKGIPPATPVVSRPFAGNSRDIAISHDGSVVLIADETTSLKLKVGTAPSTSISPGASSTTLFLEVALSSDGRTAAAIGQSSTGTFQLFRIDDLTGSPVFTSTLSAAAGEVYTDVAVSADATTAIVGRHQGGKGGVERVIHFTTTADKTTQPAAKEMALNLPSTRVGTPPSIDAVDVDISADGMTALANLSSDGTPTDAEHYLFQILDADLPMASVINRFTNTCDTAGVDCRGLLAGASLSSGGSIALVKVSGFGRLDRYDGFNQNSSITLSQQSSSAINVGAFVRTQDQIDLQ